MTIRSLRIERQPNGLYRVRDRSGAGPGNVARNLSYDDAQAIRDKLRQEASKAGEVVIVSAGSHEIDEDDVDALWEQVITQQRAQREAASEARIVLPGEPVAIAFLSDMHMGDDTTDYETFKRDCEIIRDTEGMYAVFAGDALNNWIVSKLARLQRYEAVTLDASWLLVRAFLTMLRDKWLLIIAGNHDNWTTAAAGVDFLRELVRGLPVLYDPQQIVVSLEHGEATRRVCVRHRWRGSSVFNVTHGIEVSWDRMGVDFDWGIGGHTHIGTYCRPFTRHGRRRHAILLGTYKLADRYGVELGVAPTDGLGCGAMVLHPDGRQWWFDGLREAAAFLAFLRGNPA